MELLDTFIPSTIDFARQPIEHEHGDAKRRYGSSESADMLSAAALARTPKDANGIYGSVSAGDIVATVKRALAHNDEAARVLLTESNIRFVDGHGHAEGDSSRVLKQLGSFAVEIQVPGAETAITRTIRIRPKAAVET
ncbi:hypothetical protein P154DRAFT_517440 [Amniculicola lignicola CBS 123094]|uniref:Uncharacterized protein n=1 Tax=Amniculicola lignicola CBS 123094 TaxID=1392246 RepID=A0A6A5WZN4_9PLEO|nr:hypothetical protein P154DRAFT_517440 [Amniculicola lignicola CBS 123094]